MALPVPVQWAVGALICVLSRLEKAVSAGPSPLLLMTFSKLNAPQTLGLH